MANNLIRVHYVDLGKASGDLFEICRWALAYPLAISAGLVHCMTDDAATRSIDFLIGNDQGYFGAGLQHLLYRK